MTLRALAAVALPLALALTGCRKFPRELSDQWDAAQLAQDQDFLYGATLRDVRKIGKRGQQEQVLLKLAEPGAGYRQVIAIAVQNGYLYWLQQARLGQPVLQRLPVRGGNPEVLLRAVSPELTGPSAFVLDGKSAYVLTTGDPQHPLGGRTTEGDQGALVRVPLGAGSSELLLRGLEGPLSIVSDPTHLYWLERGPLDPDLRARDGKLVKLAKSHGEPEILADELEEPVALTLDGDALRFTTRPSLTKRLPQEPGTRQVVVAPGSFRVSKAGGPPQPARGLWSDGTRALGIIRRDAGTVARTPRSSNDTLVAYEDGSDTPVDIAQERPSIQGLIWDDRYFYWTESPRGALMRFERRSRE